MKNSLITLFFALSIVTAAIVAFFVVQDRKEIAASLAERAASEAEKAAAAARQAELTLKAEQAKVQAQEAEIRKSSEAKAASEAAKRAADAEAAVEDKRRAVAETEKATATEKAREAADLRAAAELTEAAARREKEAAAARQKTAEAEALKASELRAKAEADALRTKHSLIELEQTKADYANMIAETRQLEAELEEMKRALTPEKTVNDLMIVGDDSAPTNAAGKAAAAGAEALATPASRRLADRDASRAEDLKAILALRRARTVGILERLLDRAVAEKRTIDAQYYFNTLKSLYPDWQHTKDKESK